MSIAAAAIRELLASLGSRVSALAAASDLFDESRLRAAVELLSEVESALKPTIGRDSNPATDESKPSNGLEVAGEAVRLASMLAAARTKQSNFQTEEYGVFETQEMDEDGLPLMEIREEAMDRPAERNLVGETSLLHLKMVTPAKRTLTPDDVDFIDHFRKWEEIEAAEEAGAIATVAESAASPRGAAPFVFRTPADIHRFMAQREKPVDDMPREARTEAVSEPTPTAAKSSPKTVRFADVHALETGPRKATGGGADHASKVSGVVAETVVEHEGEEPPEEEDLDAFFDFKEVCFTPDEVQCLPRSDCFTGYAEVSRDQTENPRS
ncbi:hypothetical protein DFJ74DRAFT_269840 [Hyaloraphidium curvatum]|nr:hypothetical protein DFJ74DRAFT_269840 [Hyaloraphidium curvatum]